MRANGRSISGALLALTLALSACGGGSSSSSSGPSPSAGAASASPSAAASPSPSATTVPAAKAAKPIDPRKGGFEIGFGEFAITLEAKAIRPGHVTLVVHNGGTLVHGFEMKAEGEGGHSGHGGGGDEFKLEEPTFGPDDTIRIEANLPAGVYEIECYVANHESLGMRATLTVRADAPLVRPTPAEPDQVLIEGFAFDPGTITVTPGTTVTWTNEDPTEHTVTAKDGSFTSEPLPSGKGYRVTFDQAGTFAYTCAIHPTMTGTIEVAA
jgi:plastocyanin